MASWATFSGCSSCAGATFSSGCAAGVGRSIANSGLDRASAESVEYLITDLID